MAKTQLDVTFPYVKTAFSITTYLRQHYIAISEFRKQILHVVSKTYLRDNVCQKL